jgi:outer membrane protein OmpA-like peptidoglycan-associated protein
MIHIGSFKTTIIILVLILFIDLSTAAEPQKITVKHITSYTNKLMGGISPARLYFDRQQKELYVVSNTKEIIIINEDGIVVYKISLEKLPQTFCVTRDGNIFLSYGSGEINILNYRGEYKGKLDLSSVPDNTLIAIQSLHIDEDGLLYIGDGKLSRVIVLDNSGKFLFQFGKKGSGEGEFLNASSITVDNDRAYLLDPALFRVSVFDKRNGKFLFKFGQASSLLGGFSMPSRIDTDGERLFVVDTNRFVVIIFDKEGKPIKEFGGIGRNPENLSWPSDVKVDNNNMIYVTDGGDNGRVQVYELIIPKVEVAESVPELPALEPVIEKKPEPAVEIPQPEPVVEIEVTPIELEQKEEEIISDVFKNLEFQSGSDIIESSSYDYLDKLYGVLVKKPQYKLHIAGHTDNTGSEEENLVIGQKRTDAVKKYLQDKGIDLSRITTVSYGESKPIADNSTEEGRKINRRVEFIIVE